MAGEEDHAEPGAEGREGLGELPARHARHDHVGHQQVDPMPAVPDQVQGRLPVGGRQHGVSGPFEVLRDDRPQRVMVFHEQEGLGPCRGRRSGGPRFFLEGLVGGREVHGEHRPLPGGAFHEDGSPALAHDPIGHREAQPRALALLLGGEEGIEDPALDGGVHAHPGVRDPQPRIAAGGQRVRPHGQGRLEGDVTGVEGEDAPLRHRVAGVDAEVHHHLLQARRVGADVGRRPAPEGTGPRCSSR